MGGSSRRGGGGAIQKWLSRNFTSVLVLMMVTWLLFLSNSDLGSRKGSPAHTVQVIVHTDRDVEIVRHQAPGDSVEDLEADDAEPLDEDLLEEQPHQAHEDDLVEEEPEEEEPNEGEEEDVEDGQLDEKRSQTAAQVLAKLAKSSEQNQDEEAQEQARNKDDALLFPGLAVKSASSAPKASQDLDSILLGGGLWQSYGKADKHDTKNAAKADRVVKDPNEKKDMQKHVSPRRVASEGASSPRYKKSWDLKSFMQTIDDIELFLDSDFAYPEDRIIVTHENYEGIMREKMSARTGRSLPKKYPYPRQYDEERATHKQHFDTCALVGNSGVMKLNKFGKIIDSHDAIMRINQGPSKGYERYVGSRTTFRLLNKKWVSMYVTKLEGRGVLLPIESRNCTYLASRTGRGSFEKLASTVKRERPDLQTFWLASGVQNRAYKMLAAFRNAASKVRKSEYTGGDAPSSGLIALSYLLQVCNKVAVYGLSSEKSSSEESLTFPYHYFAFRDFPMLHLDSLQLRAHPHHSFEAEGDLIRVLGTGDRVKYCSDPSIPANKLQECGWASPKTRMT